MRRVLPGLVLGSTLMLLEALWLGAWLRWLAAMAGDLRPAGPLTLLALGLCAYWLSRLLLSLRIDLRLARQLSLAAGGLAFLAAARSNLYPRLAWPLWSLAWPRQLATDLSASLAGLNSAGLLGLTVGFLWWRGLRQASLPITARRARRAVATALTALALLGLLAAVLRPVALVPWVYAAMACAILLLALARLHEVGQEHGGTPADYGPTWLGLVGLATASVLGGVALLGSIISTEAAADIARALEPLPTVLKRLTVLGLLLIGSILGRFTEWLALRIRALVDLQRLLEQMGERPLAGQELAGELSGPVGAGPPLWLQNGLRIGLLLAISWILLRILSRAMRRYLERGVDDAPLGELGGGASAGRLLADLRDGLKGLAAGVKGAIAGLSGGQRGVRALYARMLDLMAERRLARRPEQTPDEFQPQTVAELPGASEALAALTAAYVEARYAEREPDAETLGQLRAAWRRIRETARG